MSRLPVDLERRCTQCVNGDDAGYVCTACGGTGWEPTEAGRQIDQYLAHRAQRHMGEA